MTESAEAAISRFPIPRLEDMPDDIWCIEAISAFFGMSNRIANVSSLRPNAEFHALGRD